MSEVCVAVAEMGRGGKALDWLTDRAGRATSALSTRSTSTVSAAARGRRLKIAPGTSTSEIRARLARLQRINNERLD